MNFDEFRKDIEAKLNDVVQFELQEYHFTPYSFGNGILAYRIRGQNHKFIFDGREEELIWLISKSHQKYFGADFTEFMRKDKLKLSLDELKHGINNSSKQ
jgi:hypothetical protein